MKNFILSIIIFFFSNISVFSHVNHYNQLNYIEYELFRNNNLIGLHKYNFLREGNDLVVESEVNFEIKKLNVVLYKYYAKSEEKYKNEIFYSFASKTKQNKKDKYVNISVNNTDSKIIIDGSSFKGSIPINSIVGTWWNHKIVESEAQISAISGRVIEQTVTFLGKEQVTIGDKTFSALKFNFKSSDESLPDNKKLNTDIWYEENSYLWLKAAFNKKGYWEYRIKTFN
jgi:hypothetical protein|tara:strand:- start:6 stop:689 length:684 start_codon:yes stop_codon:yes gene_type:complete